MIEMRTKKKLSPVPVAATVETIPTIQQALREAKNLLSVVSDQPLLEAEILLSHVLNTARSYLHTWHETRLSDEQKREFTEYLMRRRNREPISYITGRKEFWSLDLSVTPDTLIPRPETELLVESVLATCKGLKSSIRLADLGTGSGAIALALANEKTEWQIHATDISEAALQIAKTNAARLGIQNISFHEGNWCDALSCTDFDVIVSNPPYIGEMEWDAYAEGLSFEPRDALVSGLDGLDAIRAIIHSAKYYLKPSGWVFVEHGFLQGAAVRKIFAASGYGQIHSFRDLSGQERVSVGQYCP